MAKHIHHNLEFLAAVIIFVLIPPLKAKSEQGKSPPYLKFAFNATEFPSEDYYDYVIIGGGTAGCPLAATLSTNFRVLVIERGGVPYGRPNLMSRDGFLASLTEVDNLDSPAQAFTSEEGVANARGRVLGGSSAINAGFYSRGDPEFFQNSGVSWDLSIVNQSFEWVERAIVFRPDLRNWQSAFRDGLLEAGVAPYNGFSLEHKIGTKIGGTTFDNYGRRHSAADLLNYAKASNIKVALHGTVERILVASASATSLSSKSAVGVVYRDQLGGFHHAMVREKGEVIVSAGAIGSPQLLLLSGIGPRPYLSSWGIPVVHHSPYVGQFLYDNPRNGISIVPPFPLEHSLIQVVGITNAGAYLEAASTVIPFAYPARSVFIRTPSPPLYLTVASLMEKISGPLSVGSLRLASIDIRANPVVRFNYFTNPVDLDRCIAGMRKIAGILSGRSMDYFKFTDMGGRRDFRFVGPALPVYSSDDILMADFCRHTVNTIWHYHGGCIVGKVVNHDFRVIGMDALRIVDGSTFNISPGTNPQATLMMLGRYLGLKIIKERL
ncbi:Glucose-methanol-choline oxidoreductase, N-terminal [Dillenia turbinata]|uniref:Glucose-methanol-choline oxidoreductase, N-terminal n=1 Tax=Dillenia turbinata TaxID=194707 RepID=A0AAN8YVE5_9MAGN